MKRATTHCGPRYDGQWQPVVHLSERHDSPCFVTGHSRRFNAGIPERSLTARDWEADDSLIDGRFDRHAVDPWARMSIGGM